MNELKIFESHEFGKIRTIEISGKPYFVAGDIAKALGYRDSTNAIKQHCRWVVKHHIPHPQSKNKELEVNVIPEGDIYRLVTNSELPSAEYFESWVFDDVLPSIRKHGVYAVDELLNDPDLAIKAFTALKEEKERNKQLSEEMNAKNQLIGELKPKADYTDRILKNSGLVTITQIAKDYGMSGTAMNKLLRTLKIQYKQSGQWLLYKEHQSCGYTHSDTVDIVHTDGKEDIRMNTKWTQKGRLFLYELLKDKGIYPTIEKGGK